MGHIVWTLILNILKIAETVEVGDSECVVLVPANHFWIIVRTECVGTQLGL